MEERKIKETRRKTNERGEEEDEEWGVREDELGI